MLTLFYIATMKYRKCKTPSCNNWARPDGKDCNSCHSRKANPIRKAFRMLRHNSKRRGIPFNLTFEQFRAFAIETDYIRGRGKKQKSYTIDRIEPDKGYTAGNLQVLTNQSNSIKNKTLEKYFAERDVHWFVITNRNEVYDNVPF